MSDLLIRGMEMPTSCARCRCVRGCPAVNARIAEMDEHPWFPSDHRHEDCPLIHVPPHGDLVDRAEILEIAISLLDEAVTDQEAYAIRKMWSRLGQMPVYIPAEEEP